MWKFYIPLSIGILALSQCADQAGKSPDDPCRDIICTQQYVSFAVSINDHEGNPVSLDYYEVIDQETGEDLTQTEKGSQFYTPQPGGPYPLYADVFRKEHQNTQRTLLFRGFIAAEEVISNTYEVAADCCHVQLISGELNLSL